MEGKWTTNHGYFYFGKVNYSWTLYCRLTVPKVALRMIFLSLWALGVIVKWVAITFGSFPLHIQCPSPTYFSGIKDLVALSKLMDFQLLSELSHSFLPCLTPGYIISIFTCIVHAHICSHGHTSAAMGAHMSFQRMLKISWQLVFCFWMISFFISIFETIYLGTETL